MVEHITNDSLLGRYYVFLNRLAMRRGAYKKCQKFLDQAVFFGKKSNNINVLTNAYHGLCDLHLHNAQREMAKKYKDSLTNLISRKKIKQDQLSLLSMLAKFHAVDGTIDISRSYLEDCLALSTEYPNCKLELANLEIFQSGEWTKGLKILWEILLNDPQISQMVTVWSLQSLAAAYIEAYHYSKAEELINLVLSRKTDINERSYSEFLELKGDLLKEMGKKTQAFDSYRKALEINPRLYFQARLNLKIFLEQEGHDESSKKVMKKLNMLLQHPEANTDDYLHIYEYLSKLQQNPEETTFLRFRMLLEQLLSKEDIELLRSYEKKQIYEHLMNAALNVSSDSLYFTYYNEHLQDLKNITVRRSQRTNDFLEARLGYFENKLFESDMLLGQREMEINRREATQKQILIGLLVVLFILTMTTLVLAQTKKNQRKIKSLSDNLEKNNKELTAYSKDYEFMLLTLSHHVKEPVNQFRHGIEILKSSFEKGGKQSMDDIDFVLQTMQASNRDLSSRLSSLLTFLKNRIDKKSIKLQPIDILELVQNKTSAIESIPFTVETDGMPPYIVNQSFESLHIVIDNLLENVIKYGVASESAMVFLGKANGQVFLEIKNKVSESNKSTLKKIVHPSEKRSFGLGFLIVKLLCTELGIDFTSEIKLDHFHTRLVFKH